MNAPYTFPGQISQHDALTAIAETTVEVMRQWDQGRVSALAFNEYVIEVEAALIDAGYLPSRLEPDDGP